MKDKVWCKKGKNVHFFHADFGKYEEGRWIIELKPLRK